MSDQLFTEIQEMSLEIQSLIRQGVKDGVEERINKRNELLQEWFAGISQLIQMTNEQQTYLETLLMEEQQLVEMLRLEQTDLHLQQSGRKKASFYQQH